MQTRMPLGLYLWMNVIVKGELVMIAAYAAHDAGLGPTSAAIGVAYAILVMRFGRVVAAPILLRLQLRSSVALCFAAVAVGSLTLASVQGLIWFLIATTAIGVGFGACLLMIKVFYVAGACGPGGVLRPIATLAVTVNVGAALGPLLLLSLADGIGRPATLAAAGIAGAAGAVLAAGLPAGVTPTRPSDVDHPRAGWMALPLDAWLLMMILVGAFALYSQLYIGVPLLADARGWGAAVGLLFVLNAIVIIVFQLPVSRWLAGDARLRKAAAGGVALLGLGVVVILVATSLALSCLGVLVFSFGECLALPTLEAAAASTVARARVGSLLALAAAAMGLGESAGAFLGVHQLGRVGADASMYPAVLCVAGFTTALALATWSVVARTTGAVPRSLAQAIPLPPDTGSVE